MIDILFLAHNRLAFTRTSLDTLCQNTEWSAVRRLIVCDDESQDETREYLRDFNYPCDAELVFGKFGSPVAVMNRYLCEREGENDGRVFAKIDNDVMVPPGWLTECLKVMGKYSDLSLLGIEAFTPLGYPAAGDARDYEPARHIGGIGVMRAGAFVTLPRPNGRFGFTAWQEHAPIIKGWIKPALPVFLLDKLPREPFRSLSAEYTRKGWQRDWGLYPESHKDHWSWFCE